MSSQLLWWVNDQNPAYADTITVNGVAVDLSTKTAQFKMRAVGSATLKVNQPVTTKDASGNFTYAWAASDLDTANQYLVWVEVTAGGKPQTLYEAIIEVRAHSNAAVYVEAEQLKSSFELTGTTYADQDIRIAVASASRIIDGLTGRRFFLDAGAANVRYYTPDSQLTLMIDDLVTLTSVKVDRTADGVYEETWTAGTDFVLAPFNAAAETPARPYDEIRVRRQAGRWFPCEVDKSVEVTGQFGWAAVPDDIRAVTFIVASKMLQRVRVAPFGIVMFPGMDQGVAMRIARFDPDVAPVVANYNRSCLLL